MSDEGRQTPLPPSLVARLAVAARHAISGVAPDTWFGPQQPLSPQAPPEVKGRQFDYPFGVNLSYVPRATGGVSFAELRALADALPLLRAVIETRKDQVAALSYSVRARDPVNAGDAAERAKAALALLTRPDRRHSFSAWLRMLLEDMLVIDAATLYPRFTRDGALHSLDVIDGATITPLIGEDGRSPDPPDPAYQQILHGVPAADFSSDELIYLPRNVRAHKLYGFSPVEQTALTVNIALRREAATLDYYRAGSTPDAFATLPKEWTVDQIRQFQDYFDALMSGNSARRRMTKFMPADFRLIEARQPPLKDQYDEWLARVICYAFSVPASAFVGQVNRATSETLRLQATQEGLVPLKAWIKAALDHVIQVCLGEPDLEFVWVGDDAVDPLQQAQTLNILVGAGIKTVAEARAELGLAAEAKAAPAYGKYNQYHDERGLFTDAEHAVEPGAGRTKPPKGVQVASRTDTRTDAGVDAAQTEHSSSSDQLAAQGQSGSSLGTSKYSVNLQAEEEFWGGHAAKDHVGKAADELIAEQEVNRKDIPVEGGTLTIYRKSESSYLSWEAANDFVNRLLQAHAVEVDKVASGQWPDQWIEDRIGYPTGIEATPDASGQLIVRNTYGAGVFIVHDARVPRGYRVETAYPTNDDNSYPLRPTPF